MILCLCESIEDTVRFLRVDKTSVGLVDDRLGRLSRRRSTTDFNGQGFWFCELQQESRRRFTYLRGYLAGAEEASAAAALALEMSRAQTSRLLEDCSIVRPIAQLTSILALRWTDM